MKDESGGALVQKIKEMEYSALKAEGLKRIEMRLQNSVWRHVHNYRIIGNSVGPHQAINRLGVVGHGRG
jgi:hypothetical protein